jgi:hypothetical protein
MLSDLSISISILQTYQFPLPPSFLPTHYTTLHHPSLPSHSNKVTKNTIKNFLLHAYMPKSKQANAGEKMQIITSSAATLVPRKRR